jgi:hypothetical protein
LRARPAIAEPYLRQAVALGAKVFDERSSPDLADAEIALAECLLDLKKINEARALAIAARSIHAQHKKLGDQYRGPLRTLEANLNVKD